MFESSASIHSFVTAEIDENCLVKCKPTDKYDQELEWKHSIPNFAAYGGKEICLFNMKAVANGTKGQYACIDISPVISNHVCKDWIMDVR